MSSHPRLQPCPGRPSTRTDQPGHRRRIHRMLRRQIHLLGVAALHRHPRRRHRRQPRHHRRPHLDPAGQDPQPPRIPGQPRLRHHQLRHHHRPPTRPGPLLPDGDRHPGQHRNPALHQLHPADQRDRQRSDLGRRALPLLHRRRHKHRASRRPLRHPARPPTRRRLTGDDRPARQPPDPGLATGCAAKVIDVPCHRPGLCLLAAGSRPRWSRGPSSATGPWPDRRRAALHIPLDRLPSRAEFACRVHVPGTPC